ncbi:MAG: LPS-assembly protein LptD [Planctomycetota bacterium]
MGPEPKQTQEAQETQEPQAEPPPQNPFRWNYSHGQANGDRWEEVLTKGVTYQQGDLEIHADSAVVFFDRDEYGKSIQWGRSKKLPRRGTTPPRSRRRLSAQVMRDRLASLLRSMGSTPPPPTPQGRQALRLFRSLYMEGNVIVRHKGVEAIRASRLYLSTVDDRAVFEEVTMRLLSTGKDGRDRVVVVRAPKLVRQGKRTSGRQASVTTCTAGKPHFEVFSGELEIIQREDDFEVRSKDNTLAFGNVKTLPFPNVSFYTSDQNQIPIQGFTMSYNETERFIAKLDLGGSINNVGGAVHNALTGRDASEFRGDWHLGLGYNYKRGGPVEAGLTYKAKDQYRGETLAYYLHDNGENIREIQFDLSGQLIDNVDRSMVHSENRFHLGPNTYVDLSLFDASDEAVWSEFFRRRYMNSELPETSAYLRHDRENMLVTVEGRWNLAGFSYGDDRALAPAFNEKLPVATLDWYSQKISDLPGDGELLLTTATNVGQQRNNFDNTLATTPSDRTFRVDQAVELAAPYYYGPFALRPAATVGFTHFDNTVNGDSRDRFRFAAGAVLSTRLARTFETEDAKGRKVAIQHVMNPTIEAVHEFKVDGEPTDFFQHDTIDALDEQARIRLGLVNRLKHVRRFSPEEIKAAKAAKDAKSKDKRRGKDKVATGPEVHQVLWADVGQTIYPISGRDNAGHHLGFLDYELIVRPLAEWTPVPHLALVVRGEHDWNKDRLHTFSTALSFGKVLGVNWAVSYFTDHTTSGAIGYSANTDLFGRWSLIGLGQYDLELEENLSYGFTLQRQDHDWVISAEFEYDSVTKDRSFHINFEPVFGGLFQRRRAPSLVQIYD